ncbi:MAG: hypothetical protein KA139_04745 [Rhodobacteraceae bacterium]|nr:hypothetical protein [Paracoccaceae bacterium]
MAAVALAAVGLLQRSPGETRTAAALPPPVGRLRTYHLGHSLVGRDMPAMLAAMAGHDHASQLGWGASLRDHGKGEVPGFEVENAHADHIAAEAALASGSFDAVVLTEMVELRDAIRWHDSARWLAHWAKAARAGNPGVRVYLYETWHKLDDPEGWLERIEADLQRHWLDEVLHPAMARGAGDIHLIPGGQVMAEAARVIEAGGVPGLTSRRDLFQPGDLIHFNDLGAWLMAVTHHAVLYHRLPTLAPVARADGSPADLPPEPALLRLQEVVWQTVSRYRETGLSGTPG